MDYELMFRYITGKATAEEIEKFEAWLNSSASNWALFNDWAGFWEVTGKSYMDFEPDTDQRWEEIKTLITGRTNKTKIISLISKNWYRIAASILLFALLGTGSIALFKTGIIHREKYLTYVSGNDTLSLLLADGSRVSLNTNSEIKISKSFKKNKRSVQLTGEAFFNITRDPEHPFKVFAHQTVTEVLGTSFNIKTQASDVCVTLVTGKVAFFSENDKKYQLILNPGQHGIFNNSTGLFSKDTVSNLNNIAWKTKRLQFRQTPMDELCHVLSAYYNKKIVFADTDKSKGNFTGIINRLSLNEAVRIVELTMGAKADQYRDSVVFSFRKNETMTPHQ
jgi:transmembrane sensor